MPTRVLALAVLGVALLGGCVSDQEIAAMETERLLMRRGEFWKGALTSTKREEAELRQRNVFTEDQWTRLNERRFRVGDPEEMVLASMGTPDDGGTYVGGGSGVWKRWHYRGDTFRPTMTFIIQNGQIASMAY